MRDPALAICIALATACLVQGCARRGPAYASRVPTEETIDLGVISLRSPIPLTLNTRRDEPDEDGVATRMRIWEGRTPVYGLMVASIRRAAPFTGPRDRILAASMGERIRGGSLGEVTYDYTDGVFTASADAEMDGGSVHVRAFMSRTELAVVVCGGRSDPVMRTMASIVVRAEPAELFFAPARSREHGMHVAWGLGFSCVMPGGVTVEETERGSLRYAASNDRYVVHAFVLAEPDGLDVQQTRAVGSGTVLEVADTFDGGLLVRRLLVGGADGRWHAWMLTSQRAFHLSGAGAQPTTEDREAIAGYFGSCTF